MSSPDESCIRELVDYLEAHLGYASESEHVRTNPGPSVSRSGPLEPQIGRDQESSPELCPPPETRKEKMNRLRLWRADEDRLREEGKPWYEVLASYVDSDAGPAIRRGSGMPRTYKIRIPGREDRAYNPPAGYHTFYIDQIEIGLRFPVPKLIQTTCNFYHICPSQLSPNSFSSFLALGVLFNFFQVP